MADLIEDTRQQAHKHEVKHAWFAAHGVEVERRKLDFGDYMRADGTGNISVDTKRSIDEIAQNIGGKEHARFRRECERARDAGYRLVVLIEQDRGYDNLGDLVRWTNTHCVKCGYRVRGACRPHVKDGKCPRHKTKNPIQGARLYKAMCTMHDRYAVNFEITTREECARRICEILGLEVDE